MASNLKQHPYAASINGAVNSNVKQTADAVSECVSSQIDEKPISSVAVAVGAGIGVGLLMTAVFSSERTRRARLGEQVSQYLQSRLSNVGSLIPNQIADRFN